MYRWTGKSVGLESREFDRCSAVEMKLGTFVSYSILHSFGFVSLCGVLLECPWFKALTRAKLRAALQFAINLLVNFHSFRYEKRSTCIVSASSHCRCRFFCRNGYQTLHVRRSSPVNQTFSFRSSTTCRILKIFSPAETMFRKLPLGLFSLLFGALCSFVSAERNPVWRKYEVQLFQRHEAADKFNRRTLSDSTVSDVRLRFPRSARA